MGLAKATSERERRDLVSRQVMDESALIRFVVGPDGQVVPDLARRLPGRGLWVAADRDSVSAAARGLFARAAKAAVTASPQLAEQVEALIEKRCLEQLGLARREGVLISGFEKSAAALRTGRAAWLIEAADGARDGRSRLLALARHAAPPVRLCGAFTAEQLSLALGLENAIHSVLLAGGRADRWSLEFSRLTGFRSPCPTDWGLAEWDRAGPAPGTGQGPAGPSEDGVPDGPGQDVDGRGLGS